jgi:hypothetical protein
MNYEQHILDRWYDLIGPDAELLMPWIRELANFMFVVKSCHEIADGRN